MSRARVLIVDDDPIVLEVVRERLEQAGYEVHTREDALGTSQWIAQHQPDLVLLDIKMPALTGKELATLLKKRAVTRSVGVILHSSLDAGELTSMMRSTGAIGVIQKTGDAEVFMREFLRLTTRHFASKPPPAG